MENIQSICKSIAAVTGQLQRIEEKLDQFMVSVPGWFDPQDVCNMLHISKRTLDYYREKGVLPFSKIGGKIFYKISDIEGCLTEHLIKREWPRDEDSSIVKFHRNEAKTQKMNIDFQ